MPTAEGTTALLHAESVKMRTVTEGSVVPFKVGVVLAFDGDAGEDDVNTGGATADESCVYVTADSEQPDVLSARSRAVA